MPVDDLDKNYSKLFQIQLRLGETFESASRYYIFAKQES